MVILSMSERRIATLQILLSGFLFGFLGIWGKWAFSLGITPGELLGVRFSLASLMLFCYLFWRNHKLPLKFPWLSAFHLVLCLLLGILGYAVFASCYFIALKGLSASMTVLLLYLYPVFVAIGARIFLSEHLGRSGLAAVFLAAIGLVFLVWGDFSVQNSIGFIAGLISAIVYSIYILVSRKYLYNIDAITSACWMQFGTGVTLLALNFSSFSRLHEVIVIAWQPIIGISVFSTVFSMVLFLQGLKKLTSAEASVLNTSEPITAIFMASLLLGESLSMIQIVGGVFVIVAMIIIARQNNNSPT